MTIISPDIVKASEILNNEDLVAIPTETVYGLAGNIYSEKAIRKIFELKQRPLFNPLIVHIHDIAQLEEIAIEIPDQARLLADRFWPGSLTLVLKKRSHIPDLVTAGKNTVAVRMPNHPLVASLLKQLRFPLAAPSANPFGLISPTRPQHVEGYFKGALSMILDGGECKNGIESTIIGFEEGEAVLYRLGAIAAEEIEAVLGTLKVKNKKEQAPDAPGMLSRHYAPRTRTYLTEDVKSFLAAQSDKRVGALLFRQHLEGLQPAAVEILSSSGSLEEAAAQLYASLHKLDQLNLDMIVAERFPNVGLGQSINDRLERATKQ